METKEQLIGELQKCELCAKKMNPTVHLYDDIRLCTVCFNDLQNLPEIVVGSLERFLIGNVV